MWLIRAALRRPITVLMLVLGAGLTSILALQRMRADILPQLGTPVLYVAQAYGGMDPAQMEGYLVNYYEFHFLYINGIDRVESKSIQDVGLVDALLPSGNGHGAGAGRNGRAGQSRARLHAAWHRTSGGTATGRRQHACGLCDVFQ